MRNILIILSIVSIIFVSGCSILGGREVTVDANNGLKINEFSSDFGLIYDDEETVLYLEVENVGGTTATNVKAQVYGVSGWDKPADTDKIKTIGSLEKPDIATNVPGEFSALQWTVDPPALPEGLKQVFKISSRVRYEYYTNSISNIDVISRAQYNLLRRTGELEQVPIESSNTNGPTKMSVDMLAPIKLDEIGDGIGTTEKNLLIYVRNVGDGIPFGGTTGTVPDWPAEGNIGEILLKLSTPASGVELKDCIGSTGTVEGTTGVENVITLRNGYESYKGVCTLIIPNDFAEGVPKETLILNMEATYGYYIDTPVDVTVISTL